MKGVGRAKHGFPLKLLVGCLFSLGWILNTLDKGEPIDSTVAKLCAREGL